MLSFGHDFISAHVGLNMEFNMMIFGLGDIIGTIWSVLLIGMIPRVKAGIFLMGLISLLLLIASII